jgi:peptide-methionine (R)-S-oxide reductase
MKRLSMPIDRRSLLLSAAALTACSAAPAASTAKAAPDRYADSPWRKLTEADWQKRLPAPSFQVLRQEGTETPFTSPLNNEHRHGTFACLGCGLPLFKSEWKFDSGTGWPSFYTEIPARWARRRTSRSSKSAPSTTAPSASAIRATFSTTAQDPRACATAITAWR